MLRSQLNLAVIFIVLQSGSVLLLETIYFFESPDELPSSFDEGATGLTIKNCGLPKLENLEKLQHLNVTKNELITLDGSEFLPLASLEVLSLKLNGIKEVPVKQFSSLRSLKQLYLDENHLSTVDKKLFSQNFNLAIVSLSANEIEKLHCKTFSSLTNLLELDLSLNRLTSLPAKLLERNEKLQRLDLYNNNLQHVESSLLNKMTALILADFEGNTCIAHWINPSDIQKLNETINGNCLVDKDTELQWLREEVEDLKEEISELKGGAGMKTLKTEDDVDCATKNEELNHALNICQEKLHENVR